MINDLKPWKKGNNELWSLNKLYNIQKHNNLLLVSAMISANLDYIDEGIVAKGNVWSVEPGFELLIVKSNKKINVTSGPNINFTPTFPKGSPFEGEHVFKVMEKLYGAARTVIEKIYFEFRGHKALS